MTKIAELQTQIEITIMEMRKNYKKATKTVALLKNKINDLELSTSEKSCARTDSDMKKLNSAMERFDSFVDSVILKSARAKRKYEKLKRECRMRAFEPVRLEDLKTLCLESEQLAKDLLCYSLGHFKRASSLEKPIPTGGARGGT